MKSKRRRDNRKSAIDILEEATHLLRGNGLLLVPYYVGSLPFVLGLLYFWTDMSTGADAWRHCFEASLGLTLLFIWMKTWQGLYARRLLETMRGEMTGPLRWVQIIRAAAVQTVIQPWSIIFLPIALILMLPFPQTFAFFQNASLMGSRDENNLGTVIQKSWRQASLWPMQNALIIWLISPFLLVFAGFFIFVLVPLSSAFSPGVPLSFLLIISALLFVPLCPLGVIAALNIAVTLLLFPWLLKILFDIESVFSISGLHAMNTTFFAVICSLTYLCLDPLMKACYCLRCFYGESLKTGDDLKIQLLNHAQHGFILPVFIAFFLIISPLNKGLAQPDPVPVPSSQGSVSAQQLDSAVERILHYPEYNWRLQREKPPDTNSAFRDFLGSILRTIHTAWNYVKVGLNKFWNFIKDILSRILPSLPKLKKPGSTWTPFSRAFIIVPLFCIMIWLAFLAWRAWKNSRPRKVTADLVVTPLLDITREDLDAAALPEDGWLNLARELVKKGELRLALRALYLATLTYLAHREFITIAKYKSDREYELELRRRSHTQPLVAELFAENRALFECGWYGLHEVTPGIVERFSQNQEKIRTYAQR